MRQLQTCGLSQFDYEQSAFEAEVGAADRAARLNHCSEISVPNMRGPVFPKADLKSAVRNVTNQNAILPSSQTPKATH